MPPSWISVVEAIINGEPISAATANRPILDLAERTDYLKALIDTLGTGRGAYDFDAACASDVYEGAAVYWDSTNKEYALGLAAIQGDGEGNYGSYSESSYCVGVCMSKTTSTRGVIALNGRVDEVDFSTAIGGAVEPGPYYLSATTPGGMSKNKPVVGILVMHGLDSVSASSGSAIVVPSFKDIVEDHVHYTAALTVTDGVASTDAGWVAAADAIFSGTAPTGAVYGYNIDQDTTVSKYFPFTPTNTTYVELDGVGARSAVVVDNNGIWWMDTVNDPSDYADIDLYFVKMTTATQNTVVTSIQPFDEEQSVELVDCSGNSATSGDLKLKARLALEQSEDNDVAGWRVFKALTTGNVIKSGPVVESIKSDTLSISFEQTDGEDEGITSTSGGKAGRLVIDYSPSSTSREGGPSLTSLYNARTEAFESGTEEIPYIALPEEDFARVSYKFEIPSIGLSAASYTMTFWTWVLATIGTGPSGTDLPSLTAQYKVLSNADGTDKETLSSGFSVSTALTYAPNGSGLLANEYVRATLGSISVTPGDQVIVLVNRNESGDDGYAGDVGLLRAGYTLA